jgi:DNA-binding Xre family transcriptional regulator
MAKTEEKRVGRPRPADSLLAICRGNLTVPELAEISGVSERSIHRHEAKKGKLKKKTLAKIAEALKIDVEELIEAP